MAEGWTVHQAVLVFSLMSLTALGLESCPPPCSCRLGSDEVHVLDCSRKKLSVPPLDLPDGITHVSLNHNDLIAVPYLGDVTSNITSLSLVHNRISELATLLLQPYVSLETLDLSSNSLSEIKAGAFPSMQLKYLNLSNNKISLLEPGCFDNISSSLLVLRLNRNRIALLPYKVFRLPRLQLLEFKRNKIKMVDSLIFKGMEALKTLKMQRNGITKLMDGAFFGLNNIEELELEHNNLTEVNKGWLYGLRRLRLLRISHNSLTLLRPDSWEFCHNLEELDLSFNHMSRLEGTALAGLAQLQSLNLGDNALTHLGEGAFSSLASLRTLDIRNNEISWAIEDSVGVFVGMKKLTTLILQQNKIKSITKKAFDGLDELEHLDLSKNGIMSIHPEAVAHMHLKEFLLNSSSLLCDCLLQWLSPWLSGQPFQGSVRAVCAHPSPLQGQSLLEVAPGLLLCDDFPKPLITTHPESSTVLRGTNVTLSCLAASSSDSPMAAAWRRDGELLYEPEVQTYARFQDGQLLHSSLLHLLHVNFTDEGRYQCVVSNHFGSNYSNRARLTVNELPSFLKTPMDLTLRTGTMARLECAAEGHPAPQIAWQKDGGTDFPAARERRMHVMPDDDIFFIANVKTEDMGVYSCTAQNTAGSLSANATLTVLETPSLLRPLEDRVVARGETAVLQCIAGGSPAPRINWTKDDGPLVLTERHFFAAANQLLIIVEAGPGDAGRYTCSMSNTLGTERGQVYLGVAPQAGCEAGDADGWATVGIVVMVVVSCVVGTSLVWVIVIYHMRRRGEDYSITNTDELTLPADIPSYLSSQGTLSEPVEGYSNSEAGSHQQLMPPLSNTHTHKGTDGVCYGDTGSEVEAEPSRGSSLFTGSEVEAEPSRGSSLFTGSFYPGETEGLGGGAAGPLVTCSDCYDNGSMYSRPRESCPFLSEEDALEQALPPRPPGGPHHAPRHTPDSSQDPSLCRGAGGAGGHPQHSCSEVSSRSFWAEGRDPTLQAPPQPPGPRGAPPPGLASGEGQEEGGGGPQYILQKCLLQD